jgi:EpsI family protein
MTKLLVAALFLAANFYAYYYLATDPVIPPRDEFQSFPLELGEWACHEPEEMTAKVLRNLGVTDYLICAFERPRPHQRVGVYVGYHATQVREEGGGAGENSIHPPKHCLPGSGWDIIDQSVVDLEMPGLPGGGGQANRMVIARGEARQLVYYWYQSRGRVIAEDWKKVLYVGVDRATQGRTDGSLVRFTIPILRGDEEPAEAAFRDLAPRIIGRLPEYVPS